MHNKLWLYAPLYDLHAQGVGWPPAVRLAIIIMYLVHGQLLMTEGSHLKLAI